MPSDEQSSEQGARLVLVKGSGRARRPRRSPSTLAAAEPPEFQLIDCRPNLYERLASAGPGPAWKRFARAVEDRVRFFSSKLRHERR